MSERLSTALAACGISYDPRCLEPALRQAISFGVGHYINGRPVDDPGVVLARTHLLLDELGIAEAGDGLCAAVGAAYASVAYERTIDPAALLLLQALRERGFKIGIISDWEPDLAEVFEGLGARGLIDSFSISSVVGATKPAAALFRDALAKLDVEPASTVHVGDYFELDVAGARSVGMRAILYDWKGLYEETCVGSPVARSFDELQEILLALSCHNPLCAR